MSCRSYWTPKKIGVALKEKDEPLIVICGCHNASAVHRLKRKTSHLFILSVRRDSSLHFTTLSTSFLNFFFISVLFDCQLAYSVASSTTNAIIFQDKSVRFGLIAVVQSASILQCFFRWLLLIIFEAPKCPSRQPRVFFHVYPLKVVARGQALFFFHFFCHFFGFLNHAVRFKARLRQSIALFFEALDFVVHVRSFICSENSERCGHWGCFLQNFREDE